MSCIATLIVIEVVRRGYKIVTYIVTWLRKLVFVITWVIQPERRHSLAGNLIEVTAPLGPLVKWQKGV